MRRTRYAWVPHFLHGASQPRAEIMQSIRMGDGRIVATIDGTPPRSSAGERAAGHHAHPVYRRELERYRCRSEIERALSRAWLRRAPRPEDTQ